MGAVGAALLALAVAVDMLVLVMVVVGDQGVAATVATKVVTAEVAKVVPMVVCKAAGLVLLTAVERAVTLAGVVMGWPKEATRVAEGLEADRVAGASMVVV